MFDELEGSKRAGTFGIPPGKEIYGELTFAGSESSLYVQDKERFDTLNTPDQCVKGVLLDQTKVTLINCLPLHPEANVAGALEERYYFAKFFPHHVAYGGHHIDPSEKAVLEVRFVVDDATTLFYDFDAFGSVRDARPLIEEIVQASQLDREIPTGPDPQILYFTGKREIFVADTVLGKISATHNPGLSLGSPKGHTLNNTIVVSISFEEAVTFDDAITHTCTILRYLGMLAGRPQNILQLNVRAKSGDEGPFPLQVYWSMPLSREPAHDDSKPHPADILINAVREPEAFSNVLKGWLEEQDARCDARLRFFEFFAKQRRYDIGRLVGSANMFDILPSSVVPPDVPLSDEMKAAKKKGREIFKALPQSIERDSILNALGRLGKSSLKHKIRHRSQIIIDIVGERFPELFVVTDEAINCRNHYVHGSKPSFDYTENFDLVSFFIDTLEFVFATSDLIDAGWDVNVWIQSGTTMSHPFGAYYINYAEGLKHLKATLS